MDCQQAVTRLLRLHDTADPATTSRWCATVADLADAASGAERPGKAAAAVAVLEAAARATTAPSLHDSLRLAGRRWQARIRVRA
jgi:hypothetical protein